MNIMDLLLREADIRSRLGGDYALVKRCFCGDDKKGERQIREKYDYLTKMADAYDDILNRLYAAMASTYMTVDGVKLSLAAAMRYMESGEKKEREGFPLLACAEGEEELSLGIEAGLNRAKEKLPRLAMLRALDHAWDGELFCDNDYGRLLNPLNLTAQTGQNRQKDFILKVKSEFCRLAASTEA